MVCPLARAKSVFSSPELTPMANNAVALRCELDVTLEAEHIGASECENVLTGYRLTFAISFIFLC